MKKKVRVYLPKILWQDYKGHTRRPYLMGFLLLFSQVAKKEIEAHIAFRTGSSDAGSAEGSTSGGFGAFGTGSGNGLNDNDDNVFSRWGRRSLIIYFSFLSKLSKMLQPWLSSCVSFSQKTDPAKTNLKTRLAPKKISLYCFRPGLFFGHVSDL